METIKCYLCGADMESKKTSTAAGWGKYKLIINGIDAHVCPQCGEIIYSSEDMHMIQELGKSLARIDEKNRPDVLNVAQVADLLKISNQSVYNMIKDRRLKAVKIGREWRFMRKDIERILNGHEFLQES
mgnify:CR=1 FL=1